MFGIRYLFFWHRNSIRVFEQLDRIPVRIASHIFRTKCLVRDKYLYVSLIFSSILCTIRYLVFGNQIVTPYSDFLIPYSIRSLVFGFSQYRIVFDIRYLVISKNQIILGICIRSKKGISHSVKCKMFKVILSTVQPSPHIFLFLGHLSIDIRLVNRWADIAYIALLAHLVRPNWRESV